MKTMSRICWLLYFVAEKGKKIFFLLRKTQRGGTETKHVLTLVTITSLLNTIYNR